MIMKMKERQSGILSPFMNTKRNRALATPPLSCQPCSRFVTNSQSNASISYSHCCLVANPFPCIQMIGTWVALVMDHQLDLMIGLVFVVADV